MNFFAAGSPFSYSQGLEKMSKKSLLAREEGRELYERWERKKPFFRVGVPTSRGRWKSKSKHLFRGRRKRKKEQKRRRLTLWGLFFGHWTNWWDSFYQTSPPSLSNGHLTLTGVKRKTKFLSNPVFKSAAPLRRSSLFWRLFGDSRRYRSKAAINEQANKIYTLSKYTATLVYYAE